MKNKIALTLAAIALAACSDVSHVQKATPNKEFKEYREQGSSVLGVGDPISRRQMRANALLAADGTLSLEDIMKRVSNTYNVAVRWGSGVRKLTTKKVMISDLTFDEARAYIEDVYGVQIVREGERRLLVLTSADEERLEEFSPGVNVSLAQAVRGLADQCGLNLVITENKDRLAETSVTTSLRNVTCHDAFEAILAPHGLSLFNAGEYYTISGLPMRKWTLNLMEPLREDTQEAAYSASIAAGTGDTGGGSSSGSTGGNISGGNSFTRIAENRDLWGELETDLNTLIERSCSEFEETASGGVAPNASLLPPPSLLGGAGGGAPAPSTASAGSRGPVGGSFECGYVRINRTVGLVQMRAPLSVLTAADAIVNHVQDVASRRLFVEARVVAVSRERSFDQGADIGGTWRDNGSISAMGYTPAIQALRGNTGSIATAIGRLVTANVPSGGGFFNYRDANIDAVINFVETFVTTYSMMSPSVEVMDRQKVTLIDGVNDIYFISESETIPNSGGDPIVNITKQRFQQFFGIQFAVTAQIAGDDSPHTLHIQVPITELQNQRSLVQQFGGAEPTTDLIPIANTRLIDQKVRIRDGEIKVIGGLTRRLAIDAESGVPLLRGVPLLGKALNEERIRFADVEFVVLLQVRRLT
jgi:general secretion pathway protein D